MRSTGFWKNGGNRLLLIALFLCWLWAALTLHTTLIVALALAIVVVEVA